MVNIPQEEMALNRLNDGQSSTFYIQILDKLRTWISRGYLQDGEELPSERELASMFGVSRQPVNQAIKTLEYLGVVQSYRGRGVVVKNIDIQQLMRYTDFIQLDSTHGLSDLHETRVAIEIQAAKLAALRRSPEDLGRLEASLMAMDKSIVKKKFVPDTSIQFHSAIILASHNFIFKDINILLGRLLGATRHGSLRDEVQQLMALEQHRNIFEAIRSQDEEAAGEHMRRHLSEFGHSSSEASAGPADN